jgi:hypothetical protein
MVVPGAALAQQVPGLFDADPSPALQAAGQQSAPSAQQADPARTADHAPTEILLQMRHRWSNKRPLLLR